ncbi:signal recognition particle protein [Candidatus Desulforudis audaxviator]|uniref:Signal recognition particle protein n=1 Tax=Desulforudis audaxviator (strain MP104C) TaxID=477974 RepID=B1I2P8_DESAP|nr:signal recognition particle protein [Candidatus Desulforudis audaxviator]ACA59189.1 signal recognition particle protein [Candidatus Desulforudis audaxviator MP104C]
MAFAGLSERLQETFKKLRGKGKLTEEDVNQALREVRLALLEADVNFKVVRNFVNVVRQRATGQDVMASLTPAQQVVKIVHEELTALMGGQNARLELAPKPPTVVMLVGLQGSGKTTTVAKLANLLKKQGRRPLLVAADVYRPAAIKQLQVLGGQIDVPVFSMGEQDPVSIAGAALESTRKGGQDVVIIDTAGRLHINEELMVELERIKAGVQPHEILLVVDAMTGQDAVTVAESFHQRLVLDGVILTKLDGDTRGGAALSVRAVTGCPIKFVGIGEKLDALEPFHPNRMADRILGMGDVLTLIEKAQAAFDASQAAEIRKKLKSADFNLDDFVAQLRQFKKMGPLDQIMGMIPGMDRMTKKMKGAMQFDEKELVVAEAIINSMTPWERRNPERIDGSRRRRIARGSGTNVQDVNRLLKQFDQTRKLFKQFSDWEKGAKKGGKRKFPFKVPGT